MVHENEKQNTYVWVRKAKVIDRYLNPPAGVQKTAEYQMGAKWAKKVKPGDQVVMYNPGKDPIIVATVEEVDTVRREDILKDKWQTKDGEKLIESLTGILINIVDAVGAKDTGELKAFLRMMRGGGGVDTLVKFKLESIECYQVPQFAPDDVLKAVKEHKSQQQYYRR